MVRSSRRAGGWLSATEGKRRFCSGKAHDGELVGGGERHVHGSAVAPQAEQRRLAGGEPGNSLAPHIGIDDDARPGTVSRRRGRLDRSLRL